MNTAKIYHDSDGNECSILQMVRREPDWAANRIQEGEKAIEQLASQQPASSPGEECPTYEGTICMSRPDK